ncbi:MAG: DUF4405 domain-containing protein [Anaerolineales bacterium]|nr:DUF4405 domain-containing protein [Anaerolineales bacterium]
MSSKLSLSHQTRNNWLVVLLLTASGLFTIFSSVYFLLLPNGGYQGGRNPYYGIVVLFSRTTWDLIHTWAGVVMIAIAAIHIPMHWSWILTMTKRIFKIMLGQCQGMNVRGQFNLIINGVVGLSGLIVAISSLYFLFFPGGQGASARTAILIFSRPVWDVIHTWSGVIMIAATVLHFAIHWRWILKVAGKLLIEPIQFRGTLPGQGSLSQ